MFFAGAVCALLSCGVVGEVSELSEKQLEGYVAKCEADRGGAEKGAIKSLLQAKANLAKAEKSRVSASEKMVAIEKAEGAVADAKRLLIQVKTNSPPHWSSMPHKDPEVGDIGLLRFPQAEVFQAMGDNEMLARLKWYVSTSITFSGLRANQSFRDEEFLFWVKDDVAKGAIDGAKKDLGGGVWAITGTKTYTTANGGTNTVPVLERVDMERLEKLVKPVYRTWASRDGSFECEAMLVSVEKYKVTIERKEDGKQVEVFVRELSKSDRDYVEIFQ